MVASAHYIPDYELELDGLPLPAELRVALMSLRLEAGLEGADRLELQFANPGLRFLSRPPLELDASMRLSLGYRPVALRRVFAGTLTGLEPAFPAGGPTTLTVSALGHLERLRKGTKQRGFPAQLPDSVIATIVAAENQLVSIPDAAATVVSALGAERPRLQHKQSDEMFLRAIAAEYGFDMWVDGDFLNFKLPIPQLPPPELELRWGESLIDATPRVTSVGQVAAVSIRVWVEALKLQITVEAVWEDDRIGVRVRPALFGAQSEPVQGSLSLPDIPLDSPVDAIKWVLSDLRRRLNNRTTVRATVVGDPRLRVGELVSLQGLGDAFSGSGYRLTSVSHTLGPGGYRTSFDARKEIV
jgi:phage protein D